MAMGNNSSSPLYKNKAITGKGRVLPLRSGASKLPALLPLLPGNAGLMERCHDNCIYSHRVDAQEQHNK